MAVSGISFRGEALSSAKDILNQPQAHTKPQSGQGAQEAPKADEYVKPKKHRVRNTIIGTLAAAAVVVAGLVVGHRMGGFTKLIEKATAEGAGKVAKGLGKLSEYGEKAGKNLNDWGVAGWKAVKGMFSKGAEESESIV